MDTRVHSIEDVRIEALNVTDGSPPAVTVSALGKVNSTGWTHPRLGPWIYIDTPKDGILDLDFIATAPAGIVLFVISPISVGLTFTVPEWVRGVRVHSSTNAVEAMLGKAKGKGSKDQADQGKPGPWPFPWQGPEALM